jgi:hypothetical protein
VPVAGGGACKEIVSGDAACAQVSGVVAGVTVGAWEVQEMRLVGEWSVT